MTTTPAQALPPVRSVELGTGGGYVVEKYTDPTTNTVTRANAYTLSQLQTTLANVTSQYNTNTANINAMIALLTPASS